MPLDPIHCPTDLDETAEELVMGRLPTADAAAFRSHCATCIRCAAAVKEAKAFVLAMQDAAQRLEDENT